MIRKAFIGLAVVLLAMVTVSIVSADHYDYGDNTRQCGWTLTWNSGNYNVEVGINENERGYYFEMDSDVRVTTLDADRYLVHFTEADAGERHTFYAQAHTSGRDAYSMCEVHGAFRVKGKLATSI